MNEAPEKKGNGLAIGALICSVLFCIPLLPLVGIVLAGVALAKAKPGTTNTLAIVALVVGIFSLVGNVGVLAAIAIPNFIKFQLRSKQAEVKVNLNSIKFSQLSFAEEKGFFAAPPAEGNQGGPDGGPWSGQPCSSECSAENPAACNFSCIAFQPIGTVRYLYACNSAPGAFTCAASADLDGDKEYGAFVYAHVEEGASPAPVPGLAGTEDCSPAPGTVHDCRPGTF
jgi:type IV pilus assembly protein PilA